jgi:hypothetical protein
MSGKVKMSHQAPVIINDRRVANMVGTPRAGPPIMSARQMMNGTVEPM